MLSPIAIDRYFSKYEETLTIAYKKVENLITFYWSVVVNALTGKYINPSPQPTPKPIVMISVNIF